MKIKILGFLVLLGFIIAGVLSSQLYENNYAGHMQVKQSALNGDMSVRLTPGIYPQFFGNITTYPVSETYDFNTDTIDVRFNDASTAKVSGQLKYRLPVDETKLLSIHTDFRSHQALHSDIIRQVLASAIKQSATYFGAEDVYSTRRADFINLINQQIKVGLYDTIYSEKRSVDEDGNNFIKRIVSVKTDKDGNPVIAEVSAFKRYDIELIQLLINNIEFDVKTNELIAKRKEAEQEQVVAKAKAERAKQDAITAEAQGKANVALAEAEALVIKKRAVVEAEKNKEVSEQRALQAEEEKKVIIAQGEAESEAARLKVAAGLSPLEKAQIDKETAIGVAAELAKINLPKIMTIGGNGTDSSKLNPFDAVGLESFLRISKSFEVQETK